ncbi:MAG TPA: hypothetical protein VH277_10195 [Gemmatimonadaceae bacterium]|jgi:hypothetical protein|nr:hypothetical protein [Gemmatimonadaceae bacterium]
MPNLAEHQFVPGVFTPATDRSSNRDHRRTLATIAVLGAAAVMIGVYWDISWHMSIGRDTFWTPAHLLIQTGGLIAGFGSGFVALRTTFRGSPAERGATVGFWGFRAPLGAWICIWGCLTMLTSAPFDNWWHNAYGLDVKIISPPHAVLAIGIFAIVTGAMLLSLAEQNRADESRRRRMAWMFSLIGGFFLMNYALFLTEYSERRMMHSGWFYAMCAAAFPFGLASMARAIKLRWAATAAATCFTAIMLALMWFFELFPATPKLGPIYQHVTHLVTLPFPLLIIAPAVCFDVVLQRLDGRLPTMTLAPILGAAFVLAFLAVQWPFASFLMTPLADNRIVNPQSVVYWMSPAYFQLTKRFDPPAPGAWPFGVHLLAAFLLSSVTSGLGLGRGAWMRRVQR